MLEYQIEARRIDAHGSEVRCKDARLLIDTDPAGRRDALNPAELLLAAVAACMLKNIERVAPILHFEFRQVRIQVHGIRHDSPPRMQRIDYRIEIDSDESDQRLALLHKNVQKYGTIYNTVSAGTFLQGVLVRMDGPMP